MVNQSRTAKFLAACLILVIAGHTVILADQIERMQEKNHGKATVKVIRKEKSKAEVVTFFQPTFTFRIESGNPEGVMQCQQWTIVKKSGDFDYPAFQLKCGAVILTLTDISMLDPVYNEIR